MKLWLALGWLLLAGYGVLNVVSPRLTMRWQVNSTARHANDFRGGVGRAFQGLFGIDPHAGPDQEALRRVRILGVVEIGVGISLMALTFALA